MKFFKYPLKSEWQQILKRPAFDTAELQGKVRAVLDDVKLNGDAAIRKYTEQFEGVTLHNIAVAADEIAAVEKQLPVEL